MAIRTHNLHPGSTKMVSATSIYFRIMSKTISKRSEIVKSVYAEAAKHLHIREISSKFQL